MNTLTAKTSAPDIAGWLAAAQRALAPWRHRTTQHATAESAAVLLARADLYEATQPSFAADLRAGAQRTIDAR